MRQKLTGLYLSELKEIAVNAGLPRFAGGQMARWIYQRRVKSIDEMTDISKANREKLEKKWCVGLTDPTTVQTSKDGTKKYLFPVGTTADDETSQKPRLYVESVFIPEDNGRATLCVSSQVGCKMGCRFCQTGRQGFQGNLSAADILNQILALPEAEQLTNIVFMGQGEPMDNLDNVLRATEIMTANYGWAWSPKRITVSTVGVKNQLRRFLDESQCHLAISLHSPFHEQRTELMPAEKMTPIEETLDLLRQYDFSHQRRLSFEYIVFKGVNDTEKHLKAIVHLLHGLDCRVNLIRFHQIPDSPLHGADDREMTAIRDYLTSHGVFATVRASRGQDIFAACGLLNTKKAMEEGRL